MSAAAPLSKRAIRAFMVDSKAGDLSQGKIIHGYRDKRRRTFIVPHIRYGRVIARLEPGSSCDIRAGRNQFRLDNTLHF